MKLLEDRYPFEFKNLESFCFSEIVKINETKSDHILLISFKALYLFDHNTSELLERLELENILKVIIYTESPKLLVIKYGRFKTLALITEYTYQIMNYLNVIVKNFNYTKF